MNWEKLLKKKNVGCSHRGYTDQQASCRAAWPLHVNTIPSSWVIRLRWPWFHRCWIKELSFFSDRLCFSSHAKIHSHSHTLFTHLGTNTHLPSQFFESYAGNTSAYDISFRRQFLRITRVSWRPPNGKYPTPGDMVNILWCFRVLAPSLVVWDFWTIIQYILVHIYISIYYAHTNVGF